ncbi:MAG TPA: IS4 family transposase [Nitrospiraceae bacterium]|jgi:hypothetical protein
MARLVTLVMGDETLTGDHAMHATAVLQKLLRRSIPSIHSKRLATVTAIVGSAVRGQRLTLSALGRSLDTPCAVRHRIKRVDRLLGNPHLHDERLLFYRVLCSLLIGDQCQPVLIVDWSDLKPDCSWLLLRASVWLHGFALPIYEEVHPRSRQYARRVEREFLLTLHTLLPDHARPIVVTDAGFRKPWFQEVERLGWHWVGRIRNRTRIGIAGHWQLSTTLHPEARAEPQDLGEWQITRRKPLIGRLCLYRKPLQGRRGLTALGRPAYDRTSRHNARREREPWLIAASVSLSDKSALDLVHLYRLRMRIEHSFRTLKSHQFGFAFEDSQSRGAARLAALLMIHALALFLAWIAGCAARDAGLHHRLKSNADRTQTGLSIISQGLLALTMLELQLTVSDLTAVRAPPPPVITPELEVPK